MALRLISADDHFIEPPELWPEYIDPRFRDRAPRLVSRGAFGITAGGRYQWASFQKSVGDKKLYRGFGLNLGLTYRFQKS